MTTDYLPQKIERLKRLYNESNLPESNLRLMLNYVRFRKNEGMQNDTIINDVKALTEFSKCIATPIESVSTEDMYAFFEHVGKGAKSTSDLYKVRVKGFLIFAEREDLAGMVHLKRSKTTSKLPDDLLTQEEIEKMIDACQNLRDRAYIAVLYETGARRGELMDLQIRHISFDENGAIITLPKGKTGARRVRVVWAAGFIRNWLENHPLREQRDSWVWASFRDPTKTAEYRTMWDTLRRSAKSAGVQKRVNPHSFRHARATHLANDLTEQQMKQYLGWTAGSSMAAIYVHLSGRDVDNAILKAAGIEIKEEETDKKLKTVKCPRCKELQDAKASFCFKCGMPLTQDSTTAKEDTMDTALKLILQDPEILEMIKRKANL